MRATGTNAADRVLKSRRRAARLTPALLLLAPLLCARPAEAVTVMFTTFGVCSGPGCSVTLSSPGNTLTFDQPMLGALGTGIWSASGTVTETSTSNSLFLSLSNAFVQDVLPSFQGPQLAAGIEILSDNTIGSLVGGMGFASLNGEYVNSGGRINDEILTNLAALHTGGGDIILGIANAGEVTGVPSPHPFSAFDSRFIGPFPASQLLVTLNFDLGPGDGFSLPANGGVITPEPETLALLAAGVMGVGLLRGRRQAT
jgi:hypothetical protein